MPLHELVDPSQGDFQRQRKEIVSAVRFPALRPHSRFWSYKVCWPSGVRPYRDACVPAAMAIQACRMRLCQQSWSLPSGPTVAFGPIRYAGHPFIRPYSLLSLS